jgi:hypothetical protein
MPTLSGLARTVHSDLLRQLFHALREQYPAHAGCAPARIAGYAQEGFLLLRALADEGRVGTAELTACRVAADADPRLAFIYNLPVSAGFGAAIGRSLDRAAYGAVEGGEEVAVVTALLQVFMTLLDGLVDCTPELVRPYRRHLFRVAAGRAGSSPRPNPRGAASPVVRLAEAVAREWVARVRRMPGFRADAALRGAFARAVTASMRAEYRSARLVFARMPPDTDRWVAALRAKTRYPHWAQALVPACLRGRRRGLSGPAYRAFVFAVADYAGFLDDVADLLVDCDEGRWNTATLLLHRQRGAPRADEATLRFLLLTHLGTDAARAVLVGGGVAARARIAETLVPLPLAAEEVDPLLSDVAHTYLAG